MHTLTQPVNRGGVPGYHEVIKEPMDPWTVEEKHEQDMYNATIKGAILMFDDYRRYNNESPPYAKIANM